MKLNLVVTTMIVAGVVSANAFAQDNTQAQLDAMKAQIAQMQAAVDANNGGTNLPTAGWFNRINLSGLVNVDAAGSSKYSPVNFTTKHPSAIGVSSAALFADAQVSEWTKAHIGLAYSTQNMNDFNYLRPGAYTSSDATGGDGRAFIDEAYATIGNFAKSPFYMRAGKQYVAFGSYKTFADITPSFTQVLSQVNDPAVQVGFVANNGINGAAYALEGLNKVSLSGGSTSANKTAGNDAIRNWGVNLGVNNTMGNVGYNANLGYIYNMADVTGVAYTLSNTGTGLNANSGYVKAVGGVAANVGVNVKAFDASVKYVGATEKFSSADVAYNGNGAKPSAWGVDAGYSFPVLAHDSRFGLGYQQTSQASGLNMYADSSAAPTGGQTDFNGMGMPKDRYLANYTVNVSKYTDLGFEIRHDKDYSTGNGGTGYGTNTATARLAVKFA